MTTYNIHELRKKWKITEGDRQYLPASYDAIRLRNWEQLFSQELFGRPLLPRELFWHWKIHETDLTNSVASATIWYHVFARGTLTSWDAFAASKEAKRFPLGHLQYLCDTLPQVLNSDFRITKRMLGCNERPY